MRFFNVNGKLGRIDEHDAAAVFSGGVWVEAKGGDVAAGRGVSEAKAIRPKPSIIGLRPRIEDASPTPSAVTSGTVIVDVVTPPES